MVIEKIRNFKQALLGQALVINGRFKDHVRCEVDNDTAMRTVVNIFTVLAINDHLRREFHVAIATDRVLNA